MVLNINIYKIHNTHSISQTMQLANNRRSMKSKRVSSGVLPLSGSASSLGLWLNVGLIVTAGSGGFIAASCAL